jgi:hypothetical protein
MAGATISEWADEPADAYLYPLEEGTTRISVAPRPPGFSSKLALERGRLTTESSIHLQALVRRLLGH